MERVAYRLMPKSAFHFGREGLEQHSSAETFSSDSLFSALVATLASVDVARVETFLAEFPPYGKTPPLRLSSVFPMVGELPLFPRPRIKFQPKKDKQSQASSGKIFKKISYVSPSILLKLVNGEHDLLNDGDSDIENGSNADLTGEHTDDLLNDGDSGNFLQNGEIWLTAEEKKSLPEDFQKPQAYVWKIELVPRVTVDRVTQQSNVYQVGRTVFSSGCGLWFMAEVRDDETRKLLERLLKDLGDTGIGGERSAGYGGFISCCMPAPPLPKASEGYSLLLSRYNPTVQELATPLLQQARCSYDIVDVGGWTGTPNVQAQKRRRVRMLEAGSVVYGQVTGQLVDVTPSNEFKHPVYRSGIALTVGLGELSWMR